MACVCASARRTPRAAEAVARAKARATKGRRARRRTMEWLMLSPLRCRSAQGLPGPRDAGVLLGTPPGPAPPIGVWPVAQLDSGMQNIGGWGSKGGHHGFAEDLHVARLVDALQLQAQAQFAAVREALDHAAGAQRRVVHPGNAGKAQMQAAQPLLPGPVRDQP